MPAGKEDDALQCKTFAGSNQNGGSCPCSFSFLSVRLKPYVKTSGGNCNGEGESQRKALRRGREVAFIDLAFIYQCHSRVL